ncbi:hypothetical protein Ancab_033858 [Ancistrocladus abbreviatus]
MLANSEKMVVNTTTSNEWSQQQQQEEVVDEKGSMVMAAGGSNSSRVMEKPTHEQIQQQQQPLKCPRCDSTNTKFCYYNNYSLSQPRHFCKACKRYWTRGGTLRNVPVGGGCRKNKRVKRPSSSSSSTPTPTSTDLNPSLLPPPHIHDNMASASSSHMNPLFYGLPTNPSEVNFPLISRYDHHHHPLQPHPLNGNGSSNLGLGFSWNGILNNNGGNGDDESRNGYNSSKQIIQDLISPNSMFSNYNTFGSSSSSSTSSTTTTTTTPTLSSLLASTFEQHKFMSNGLKDNQGASRLQSFLPYEDLQVKGNNCSLSGMFMKEMKLEDEQYRLSDGTQNQTHDQTMVGSSDPSLFWNGTTISAWLDPSSNIGSSVSSLI